MDDHSRSWTPSLEEASSFLDQCKDWSTQKVLENSSCILECSRVVLKNGTTGHEEQLSCIRWLADLAESVPSFELETDVLIPLLTSADEYLERIYEAVQEATEVEKSALITLICALLENLRKVVVYMNNTKMCAIEEVSSIFIKLPCILYKTFDVQGRNLDRRWILESNSLLLSFCVMAETVEVKVFIDDEFQTFKRLLRNLLAFEQILEFNKMIPVWRSFAHLVTKYNYVTPVDDLKTVIEEIWREVWQQVFRRRKKIYPNLLLVSGVSEFLESLSKVCPLPLWMSRQEKQILCQELEKMMGNVPADILVASSEGVPTDTPVQNITLAAKAKSELRLVTSQEGIHGGQQCRDVAGAVQVQQLCDGVVPDGVQCHGSEAVHLQEGAHNGLLCFQVLGEAVQAQQLIEENVLNELTQVVGDRVRETNPCSEDVPGSSKALSSSTAVHMIQHDEKEQVNFFQLSPAFPLIPLNSADVKSLPNQMLNSPVPDLASSKPLPTAPGSFFILSSLSPISDHSAPLVKEKKSRKKRTNNKPQAIPAITLKVKKSCKRSMTKVKASSSPTYEQKVKKSKLISANLQKQRIYNIQKFKSLISEVNGIFKCRGCQLAMGMRSKAWNHATRCGKKKNAPRKARVRTCISCRMSFSSKRDLVKHFRSEHQTLKFVCIQCPTPSTFKYKFSFMRHLALKHNKPGLAPSFKCKICSYRTSQKANIKRHIGRVHKSFHRVSMLVDDLVNSAVEESSKMCAWERIRLNNIRERQELFETLFPETEIPKKRPMRVIKIIKPQLQMRRSDRLSSSAVESFVPVADDAQETGKKSGAEEDLGKEIGTTEILDIDFNSASGEEDIYATADVKEVEQFECPLCSFQSKFKHSYLRHKQKKHEPLEESLPCPRSFCSLTFTTRGEKEKHVTGCWLICKRQDCSLKKFSRADKYDQHLRMHRRLDEKMEE